MEPYFSVIVPVYNIEKYLSKCLDSIITQTFRDFEVILVDDGSRDSSGKICDAYAQKDERIKVVHQLNGGSGSARRTGAQTASGKYVACVDSDDWIAPDYLHSFYEVLKSSCADVVCCGSVSVDGEAQKNIPLCNKVEIFDRNSMVEKILPCLIESIEGKSFTKSLWAKVFRRELYVRNQLNVNPRLYVGEDAACVKPIIFQSEKIIMIPDCLYYYRYNPSSITKGRKPFSWEGPKLMAEAYMKGIDTSYPGIMDQIYRETVHNVFNVAVSRFYQDLPYGKVASEIKEAIKDPFYSESINRGRFKHAPKHEFASFVLKHRLICLLKLISKL